MLWPLLLGGCGDDTESRPDTDTLDDGVLADGDAQNPDGTDGVDTFNVPDSTDTVIDTDTGPTAPLEATRVACGKTVPAPASGVCGVTPGNSTVLLQGTVLAGQTVYETGYVLVEGSGANKRILCVGCDCDTHSEASGATVVACPEGVISPGLINTHDHITYSLSKPQGHGDERFDHRHDWRTGARQHSEIDTYPGRDETREGVLYGELRMLFGGATSVAGSVGGSPPPDVSGLLRNLDSDKYSGGLSGVDVDYRTFPLGDIGGELLAQGCNYPQIDYGSRARSADIYMPHIAEGIDRETRNEFVCTSSAQTGEDLIGPNTSVVHGIGLSVADIKVMADENAKLIWSPRSNIDLYGNTAQVVAFRNAGVNVALGTDWSASGSMNLLRELQCADYLNANHYGSTFSDLELWLMATYNAAIAMGADDQLGLLAEGYIADIAVFDGRQRSEYRAIIDAKPRDVVLVLRGGAPLLGDVDVINPLMGANASGCESVSICPAPDAVTKLACVQADAGTTITALRAAVHAQAYELFFCGDPPAPPSCVPYRGGEYSGMTSANDRDGDGIPDASDNCPAVFNPVRPMDVGQPDTDQDGAGDACDRCPFEVGASCPVVDLNDRDGDGHPNLDDNCPNLANPDQLDGDSDGKGDDCDACPDYANPGAEACLTTIYDIKQGAFSEGDGIVLNSVLVTAVKGGEGFFVQVHPDDPGYVSVDHSGLYIFMRGATTFPQRGDRVSFEGTVTNWYGQIEINNVTGFSIQSSDNPLPVPELVLPANISDSGSRHVALESVLVRVDGVSVLEVQAAPGPGESAPTNAFVVTGNLRVDDFFYTLDPLPTVGDDIDILIGVLRWANDHSKLEPRDAADVITGPVAVLPFDPSDAFMLAGASGASNPPLVVRLNRPAEGDTTIGLTYSDAAVLSGPASVVVPDGTSELPLSLTAVATSATSATVTATLGDSTAVGHVRVYDDAAARSVASLTPAAQTLIIGSSGTLTVTLDLPAPVGGQLVDLSVSGFGISVPATVTVPAEDLAVDLPVTTDTVAGIATVTASITGSSQVATVEVVEAPPDVDLTGWQVVQANANNTYTFPANTLVPVGSWVVIGREIDQVAFEIFWGVTLGPNVRYFNGAGFPTINGDENYTLRTGSGTALDGPTIAMKANGGATYQRISTGAAGDAASWSQTAQGPPNGTPGTATVTPNAPMITEMADATGTGNFVFEFVELYIDTP